MGWEDFGAEWSLTGTFVAAMGPWRQERRCGAVDEEAMWMGPSGISSMGVVGRGEASEGQLLLLRFRPLLKLFND